jgi:ribonuclease D
MNEPETDEPAQGSAVPYALVSTAEGFSRAMQRLRQAPRLAVDIEADSLYHYYEKVCLIQVSTDADTYILDPLAVHGVGELGPLMRDASVEKVFHAAGYDIYCLRRDYGFSFANIFDTHIAAQLLGCRFLGLNVLMDQFLGILHSKRRQRDDWSRRPLAAEQLEYAAMDTRHLLRLRDSLEAELRRKGRLSWAREEFEAAAAAERSDREFDPQGFRRIKGSGDLPTEHLAVLRALYLLRDKTARLLDVPPFKVINNSVLLDLARRPPRSQREIFGRKGISYRIARKFSSEILRTIAEAKRQGPRPVEAPPPSNWKPPDREARRRLEALKTWRHAAAERLDLHVGVVFPANLLENLASAPPGDLEGLAGLPGMRQWRVREFGEEVLRLLHQPETPAARPA